MSADEHRPADRLDAPTQWEQRLREALSWYVLVCAGSVLLATSSLPIHLTTAWQRLADIVVTAEFVVFLPAGFSLIVGAMKHNPATSRWQLWGTRLLVTGVFGLGVLLAYALATGLLPEWRRSNPELLLLALPSVLMCVLLGLGLVLMAVGLIGELRRSVRSRYRRPPANADV